MNIEQEVIHAPKLAKLLGRAESSIRSAHRAGGILAFTFLQAGKPEGQHGPAVSERM
jgi:hypothetical protein